MEPAEFKEWIVINNRAEADTSTRHHLLPTERWGVSFGATQHQRSPGEAYTRLQWNYGPEGLKLLFAAMSWSIVGLVVLVVAIVLAVVFRATTWVPTIVYSCLFAEMLAGGVGFVRGLQGVRAGRTFRNGRSFIRQRNRWSPIEWPTGHPPAGKPHPGPDW